MSANILWRPVGVNVRTLKVSTPSSFIIAMDEVFGDQHPWVLGPESLPALRGMAASSGPRPNPYRDLIDLIDEDDSAGRSIEVWPEY